MVEPDATAQRADWAVSVFIVRPPRVADLMRSTKKMIAVPIKIVRLADESQPGWVECEFSDSTGRCHAFLEKIPVVTHEELRREGSYPREGFVACEVVSTWFDIDGRSLTRIDTSRPWGIESKEGITEFVVFSTTLKSVG